MLQSAYVKESYSTGHVPEDGGQLEM